MPFVPRQRSHTSDDSQDEIEIPTGRPPWERGSEERMRRFLIRAKKLADKSAQLATINQDEARPDTAMDVDSDECEELKESDGPTCQVRGSLWKFGDEYEKSGCDLLAKIIEEFAKMVWDPMDASSPFPNCVRLGLYFLMNLVSEEIMDFILDLIRWWQEEDVTLQTTNLPNNAKELKRDNKHFVPDLSKFVGLCQTIRANKCRVLDETEKIDVPASAEHRAGSFYYISPMVFVVMQSLTPLIGGLREMPMRPETWRKQSIFRTTWARKWSHFTAPGDWGVIYDGHRCHVISQGSIIENSDATYVVTEVKQEPESPMHGKTFSALAQYDSEDARGKQRVHVHRIRIEHDWITYKASAGEWKALDPSELWQTKGIVTDYSCVAGLDLAQPATGLMDGINEDDHMFIFGMCMDGCSPYTFSNSLSGTNFLYLRPWCLRASFKHFGFACAAIPSGVDPSLAVAMLGRDIALMETGTLYVPTVMGDGTVRWQRIHAHLANFVSDRVGADNPLGRLHVGSGTRSEWKGFRSYQDGFAMGPRNDGFHAFGGNSRLFRSVCNFFRQCLLLHVRNVVTVHGSCAC